MIGLSFVREGVINNVVGHRSEESYLPKRLTKRLTEKEPHIPPTEKMATESDHRAVKVV